MTSYFSIKSILTMIIFKLLYIWVLKQITIISNYINNFILNRIISHYYLLIYPFKIFYLKIFFKPIYFCNFSLLKFWLNFLITPPQKLFIFRKSSYTMRINIHLNKLPALFILNLIPIQGKNILKILELFFLLI